MITQNVTLG